MKDQSKLLAKTQELLRKDPRQNYIIAAQLGVSVSSIRNLRKELTESPGVQLVEKVYNSLSGKNLEL
jgi:hypothetical protein